MLNKLFGLVLLALLGIISFFTSQDSFGELKTDEFVSDAAAKIQGTDILQVRYKALEKAKENAVIQAICTIISPKQFVDNYPIFKETISPVLGNYILKSAILLEEQEQDILFVKVLVKVNMNLLKTKFSISTSRKKDEREKIPAKIMVIIPETHIHVEKRKIPDPAAETEIIRQLLDYKFRVVDQSQIAIIRDTDQVKQLLAGNDRLATAVGLDYGADIVVIGEAISEYQQNFPNGLVSCSARVEARAIRTDTGDIITSHGVHASGVDSTEMLAAKKALALAGNKLAEYFIQKLQNVRTDSILAQIVISPVDYEQFKQISLSLDEISNVTSTRHASLNQGIATIDVRFAGSINELCEVISSIQFENFKLNITGFSENRIDVKIENQHNGGAR